MKRNATKLLAVLLAMAMFVGVAAGCNGTDNGGGSSPTPPPLVTENDPPPDASVTEELLITYELDENRRFNHPLTITVLIWQRDENPNSADNAYTEYIKEGMLRDHNIVVEFQDLTSRRSPDEAQTITLLLAEGIAPDACQTYNYTAITEFGKNGAVINLAPYLYQSHDLFPNLWNMHGFPNLYASQDPETGEVFWIEGQDLSQAKYITFIREDWLNKLGMDLPTDHDEFEACLVAFKENAELLLGDDAKHMVPLYMDGDIGWKAGPLIESFIPNSITDKDWWLTNIGDGARGFFRPGVKDGVRLLNKWYNMGLMDPNFHLYGSGNDGGANSLRAGWVGAFMGLPNEPYRDGELSITQLMQSEKGSDANYIAVDTFPNDEGFYRKYLGAAVDRKYFIPVTCEHPVAVLLYWDWLSNFENYRYLQVGQEGINYEIAADGSIQLLDVDVNSPHSIFHYGNDYLTFKEIIPSYAGIEGRLIEAADASQVRDVRRIAFSGFPQIEAELGRNEEIRDLAESAWSIAIRAKPDAFDSTYDDKMAPIYENIVNAAMEEREAAWQALYGDSDSMMLE